MVYPKIISNTVLDNFTLGANTDGTYVWVTSPLNNTTTQIEVSTGLIKTVIDVGTNPRGLYSDGTFVWVANYTDNTVSVLNWETGEVVSVINVGLNPKRTSSDFGKIASDYGNVWVTNSSDNTVTRISCSTLLVEETFPVGTDPEGISCDGIYTWVSNYGSNNVTQIYARDPPSIIRTIDVGLSPKGISSDNTHVWVANSMSNTVSVIEWATGEVIKTIIVGKLPGAICSDGTNCWVSNNESNSVSQIDCKTLEVIYTIKNINQPFGIFSDGTYVWVNNNGNQVSKIEIYPPAISNICFIRNTPIHLDQGIFPIDKINPKIHTINNKKIKAITQTTSLDNYLVCFEKDSLGPDYPCNKTTMSKEHRIYYKGKLIEANKFLNKFKNVNKILYKGQVLFNILMEKYDTVNVNNLICETLHPSHKIAKLFNSSYCEEYKYKIIEMLNECIHKKDYFYYQKLINRI